EPPQIADGRERQVEHGRVGRHAAVAGESAERWAGDDADAPVGLAVDHVEAGGPAEAEPVGEGVHGALEAVDAAPGDAGVDLALRQLRRDGEDASVEERRL